MGGWDNLPYFTLFWVEKKRKENQPFLRSNTQAVSTTNTKANTGKEDTLNHQTIVLVQETPCSIKYVDDFGICVFGIMNSNQLGYMVGKNKQQTLCKK